MQALHSGALFFYLMSFIKNLNKYTRSVTMPGGYAHQLPKTLRMIDRHWAGKYEKGNIDSTGKYKYWFSTSRPASEMASKNIDINTSMIRLIGVPKQSELSTWVMQRELREWLIENDFDSLINEMVEKYPKYGHIVVKVHKRTGKSTGVSLVPLENLRMDPSSKWLNRSPFVYEMHRMTKDEIQAKKGWSKTEVTRLFATKKEDYDIFECYYAKDDYWERKWYGWQQRPNATGGGTTYGVEANINQPENMANPPILLFTDEVDELPYRELKWEDIVGRWLGMGVMEYLEDNQRHDNEVNHLEMKNLYLKALKVFLTNDDSLGGNVLREMQTGQIIKTPGDLKSVGSDESDLSAYGSTHARWDQNVTKKVFAFDPQAMGGRINKNQIAWLKENTQSYYKKKQENLGLFLKNLLYNDILPSFKDDKRKKHLFTFVGSYADIDQFTKFAVEAQVNQAAYEYLSKTGFMPSEEDRAREVMRLTQAMRAKNQHTVEVPQGLYDNLISKIDIVITGENKDLSGLMPILNQFLGLLAQNPAVLQNPVTRAIAFKILEFSGMQPADLDMLDQKLASAPQGAPQTAAPGQPAPGGDTGGQLPTGSPIAKPAGMPAGGPAAVAAGPAKQL